MNAMKRMSAAVLCSVLMLTLILSGCSGKMGESKSEGEAAGKKTKITVWIWEDAKNVIDLNMPEFKKQYPEIDVDLHVLAQSDVYQNFLIAASSSDEVPDVVNLESLRLSQMIETGGLLDITDKVALYKDKMNAYKWADATKDGKIYAMPWDSGPVVMFYRNDLFKQAGLPYKPEDVAAQLKTWDDYMKFAKQLKEKTGVAMLAESKSQTDGVFFQQMLWQRDLWMFGKDGSVQLDNPEVIKTAQYFVDLVKNGYVYEVKPWSDAWYSSFQQNKEATIVGASWYEGLLPTLIDPDASGKWSVVPMPKWSADDKYGSAIDGGANLAINKNSKHPEEAWKFIEFMLGKEESQLKMMKEGGLFPSLETTYNDEVFKGKVPYFNDQPVRTLYIDAVKNVAPITYTKDYPLANELITNAFAEIFLDNKSVESVFKKAAAELRQKTGRK
ncbi:sugar ABC transporter substrate-binding protein [Paenibacillus donghaensis]|uniref:ABC transporter substrate-binding protein n=1 Tax=Paenibacillus donghaensis TaxID=414771 RepID=UPI001884171E|nr:sugar ABC transporter substrate-binding protein [Paenibacillus donghaensis]MBE9915844.1 sugar ABC transporter substrate-binding protein [Paenibacillus donghaensis]